MQYVYFLRYLKIDPFSLHARYVPNVGVYEINVSMYIDDRPTDRPPATDDRRPTTDLSFQKIRMAISPKWIIRSTSCVVLGGVFGNGGSNGAISVSKKSQMAAAAILEKFQMAISPQPVIRLITCFVLCGFLETADLMAQFTVRTNPRTKMAAAAILEKFQMAISPQPVVYLRNRSRSTYIARIARSSLR